MWETKKFEILWILLALTVTILGVYLTVDDLVRGQPYWGDLIITCTSAFFTFVAFTFYAMNLMLQEALIKFIIVSRKMQEKDEKCKNKDNE